MTKITINWQPEILKDDILKLIPLCETDFEKLFEVIVAV
jgi:hypothetical protein